MNPPSIGKYRRPTARLTNEERKNINEFGLTIPSKKTANYEPNVNEHVLLMNSRGYNYKNKARANKTASWNNYLKQRKNANTRKNNTKKNNTKRSLF